VPLPLELPHQQQQQQGMVTPPPPIAAFAHVVELEALFIATSAGQLLLLHTALAAAQRTSTSSNDQAAPGAEVDAVEEVDVVQGGVAAAGWSPNGELLAVLGHSGLLLVMNKASEDKSGCGMKASQALLAAQTHAYSASHHCLRQRWPRHAMQEWDVLAEVSVPPPAATGSADAAEQQQQPALLSASLTWRGDSNYLATNTLWGDSSSSSSSSSSSRRLLHIWDREGCQLHATGQHAPGLASAVAWQPNSRHLFAAAAVPPPAAAAAAGGGGGQQLRTAPHQRVVSAAKTAAKTAAAAQLQQQQQPDASWTQHIVLYERNGLQHGGFDVPSGCQAGQDSSSSSSSEHQQQAGLVIHSLHWSSDSKLLAVVLAPRRTQQQQEDELSGWVPHEWRLQVTARGCSEASSGAHMLHPRALT
jgi:elongator complex protein 1